MYIIGTDEAGYGPNLGPLVVTATIWNMAENNFIPIITAAENVGINIGDSKQLYHSGGSLEKLAKGVLAALGSIEIFPQTDRQLFEIVGKISQLPAMFDKPEFSLQKITKTQLSDFLSKSCNFFASESLKIIQSHIIFPSDYNNMLDQYDSKGELLSNVTIKLVVDLINKLDMNLSNQQILVLCDKHGGRNHYVDLLTSYFQDELIGVKKESREISIYNLHKIEFRFIAKGESEIPIALASMFSKYIRELLMNRFNSFWQSQIPSLKPTAGYPEDAKRFMSDIIDTMTKLKINKNEIWRLK
jgi:ribonuclease HII